ncbi:MAG: VIT1/CCC1 transporter family protein [Candidatus Helarchaeota archaeon]|nr:VIT1/CCC1 transporter family protein [Candidatus Helarchaeota archaeon]
MFDFWDRWKSYIKISQATPIMRRYFIMNGFDGSLTSLGIIIGAWIANGGILNYSTSLIFSNRLVRMVILTGIITAICLGISGLWGGFLTEEAERTSELRKLEFAMGKKDKAFKDTQYSKALHFASISIGIVNGISPTAFSILCYIPFFIDMIIIDPNYIAFLGSLILSFITLFILGMFLGKISQKNILYSGLKMLFAGLVIIFLSFMFPVRLSTNSLNY